MVTDSVGGLWGVNLIVHCGLTLAKCLVCEKAHMNKTNIAHLVVVKMH
jgi:hypothetical protein